MAKFVFITGGVVSSIGKGIVAASLGRLLKSRGYNVSILKLDPYLNVDPGTMSPFQHGEVFVTEDGIRDCLLSRGLGDVYKRQVLRRRFGLEDDTPQTLAQIGEELKLSRERVRQIETRALLKLRQPQRRSKVRDYIQGLDS